MKKALLVFIFLLITSNTQALMVSWEPSIDHEYICGYKVYLCSTYDKATQLDPDVVWSQFVLKTCICCGDEDIICQVNWPDYWQTNSFVFVAVTAIDDRGFESEPTIGYVLRGNVVGNFNDGTPYTEATIDGSDLAVFAAHFGKTNIIHQEIDCNQEFSIIIRTEEQRSDLDRDGNIDGSDLSEFGKNFDH